MRSGWISGALGLRITSAVKDKFTAKQLAVKAYKRIIRDAVQRCPGGTKRRIALETGTSMSFVSQISNPDYTVPIPAKHVDAIVKICALSEEEAAAFRSAHAAAHPPAAGKGALRSSNELCIPLPDFESTEQRQKTEEAIRASAETIINLMVGPTAAK